MTFLLFTGLFAVQSALWAALGVGFAAARRQGARLMAAATAPEPISVVVAARNEEGNLPGLLGALGAQTHPAFEVILIDDASEDRTAALAEKARQDGLPLRLIRITQPVAPRKKHALTLGIQAASHERLAFTDADCAPPPEWLALVASTPMTRTGAGATLLIGYSPFRPRPGLLNKLARYETFVTGFLTAAAVGLNRPYMAVGRNLAYSKTLFEHIGGFAHSAGSMSGDDDLLVQEVARARAARVAHLFDPGTFVWTDAPGTWRRWLHGKRRHTSAAPFYAPSIQAWLLLFHGTGLLLWAAPLFLGWSGLGLLALKLLLQAVVLRRAATTLGETDLMRAFPLLEMLYAAYNLLIAPLGMLSRPRHW